MNAPISRWPVPELADLPGFYRAYRHFTRLLFDPANAVVFKLAPGDLLLLDNRRVLHGRKAFDGAGERWLQGCYADKDGLRSTHAALMRETMPEAAE